MRPIDAETIASELVRAARGRRSQAEFSRRLGYRSNIAHRWENGECWPTAADFLGALVRLRPSLNLLYTDFFKRAPTWLDPTQPFSPSQVAAFLRQLRGKTRIGLLAKRTGYNRYSVGRWLKGIAQPRLPEFLYLVEATSRRMLDLVAAIADPAVMPSVAPRWRKLQRARAAAYEAPWSHAVLRALELEGCRNLPAACAVTWIASRLGSSEPVVRDALAVLAESGQIKKQRGSWRIGEVWSVDTSADPQRARELKETWARVAIERLSQGSAGNFGYSLFAVARKDLKRLRELHLEYVRAMQTLIAESEPSECVGLYCAQLLDLSAVDNALATSA
jgi:transcriptional regulator with XRE-family HTH domain